MNSQQKSFILMAAAMCQTLLSSYSDYGKKLLFMYVYTIVYVPTNLYNLWRLVKHSLLKRTSVSQILQRLDKYV